MRPLVVDTRNATRDVTTHRERIVKALTPLGRGTRPTVNIRGKSRRLEKIQPRSAGRPRAEVLAP